MRGPFRRVQDEGYRSGLKTTGSGKKVVDEGYRSGLKVDGGTSGGSTAAPEPEHRAGRMTTRERRQRRAERLQGWAEKREERGTSNVQQGHEMLKQIPLGQPILQGHHSEKRDTAYRARTFSKFDKGYEDLRKAEDMRSRAANIQAANDRAIYSDDEDATEKLRERIAGLEAERDRIKAYNTSARAGHPDETLLDENQRQGLAVTRRVAPFQLGKHGEFPSYALSNLNGNISKQRQRLTTLERKSP